MPTPSDNLSATREARLNFKALARSQITRELLDTFHQATGWTLRLFPTSSEDGSTKLETSQAAFCRLIEVYGSGQNVCQAIHTDLLARVTETGAPQQCDCFAKMALVAWPVLAGKHHIATLVAGQVRVRGNGRDGIAPIKRLLRQRGAERYLPQLERAWRAAPFVQTTQFAGHVRLLGVLAEMLGECACRWMLASDSVEPLAVQRAKEYVSTHLTDRITFADVLGHVHLSPQHFCKLFKKTTGMTLTEYIWHARIERAKELLHNNHHPIKQVAVMSGFRSLSHFEHVFHKLTGAAPTAFRANPRQHKANRAPQKSFAHTPVFHQTPSHLGEALDRSRVGQRLKNWATKKVWRAIR